MSRAAHVNSTLNSQVQQIEDDGFAILNRVFDPDEVRFLLEQTRLAIEGGTRENIKSSIGETYAARNLERLNPQLLSAWRTNVLIELLSSVLCCDFGLVRILYFDKHPNRTWSLPWHKDMTIAVKDNTLKSEQFVKPTRKSGVAHVEAPTSVLSKMLTLRIHLDNVTEDNGPLRIVAGSHESKKDPANYESAQSILVDAGDVLAMRPLLSHASGSSSEGTNLHRRILHFEFAADCELADGYKWNTFAR